VTNPYRTMLMFSASSRDALTILEQELNRHPGRQRGDQFWPPNVHPGRGVRRHGRRGLGCTRHGADAWSRLQLRSPGVSTRLWPACSL